MSTEAPICTFIRCQRVLRDACVLPCGHRMCREHIPQMIIPSHTNIQQQQQHQVADYSRLISCFFCGNIHKLIGVDQFVAEPRHFHNFVREQEAARAAFKHVTSKLNYLCTLDKQQFVRDHFLRVAANIDEAYLLETIKLRKYFDHLRDEMRVFEKQCMNTLETNDMKFVSRTIDQCHFYLKSKRYEHDLAYGDVAKWQSIQTECMRLGEQVDRLEGEIKSNLLGGTQFTERVHSVLSRIHIPPSPRPSDQHVNSACGTNESRKSVCEITPPPPPTVRVSSSAAVGGDNSALLDFVMMPSSSIPTQANIAMQSAHELSSTECRCSDVLPLSRPHSNVSSYSAER